MIYYQFLMHYLPLVYLHYDDTLHYRGLLIVSDTFFNDGFLSDIDTLSYSGFITHIDALLPFGSLFIIDTLYISGLLTISDTFPLSGYLNYRDTLHIFGYLKSVDKVKKESGIKPLSLTVSVQLFCHDIHYTYEAYNPTFQLHKVLILRSPHMLSKLPINHE